VWAQESIIALTVRPFNLIENTKRSKPCRVTKLNAHTHKNGVKFVRARRTSDQLSRLLRHLIVQMFPLPRYLMMATYPAPYFDKGVGCDGTSEQFHCIIVGEHRAIARELASGATWWESPHSSVQLRCGAILPSRPSVSKPPRAGTVREVAVGGQKMRQIAIFNVPQGIIGGASRRYAIIGLIVIAAL
jgi:hypothetical protein